METIILVGITAQIELSNLLMGYDIETKKFPLNNIKGYFKHTNYYVAFDNSTRDCWVEEFEDEDSANKWLNN